MLQRHGKDRRPLAADERLRSAARHGANQALGDTDGCDAGAAAVSYAVAAADGDVAALRMLGDLNQPAPDLGQNRPIRGEVRERSIGERREAVEQVADAHRAGPVGQSGSNARACARLGDRRREAALIEAREQRVEGGEPLHRPVASPRVAEGQMRVEPSDLEVRHGGERGEEVLRPIERHAQPPPSPALTLT